MSTGFHPRAWHTGAWILALLLLILALVLSHSPTGGAAPALAEPGPPVVLPSSRNEIPDPPPKEEDTVADSVSPPAIAPLTRQRGMLSGTRSEPVGSRFVTEIVDSSYAVGPAEFLALDLPIDPPGARAVHILGSVSTRGRAKDIVVRLFRAGEYERWLRKRGGDKAGPIWTSPRSRTITIDQDLPSGEAVLLLLDNGFSIRTPKVVSCQLQIQYERTATESFDTEGTRAGGSAGGRADTLEDNLPAPRSNEDDQTPPPPPPPPQGY